MNNPNSNQKKREREKKTYGDVKLYWTLIIKTLSQNKFKHFTSKKS